MKKKRENNSIYYSPPDVPDKAKEYLKLVARESPKGRDWEF